MCRGACTHSVSSNVQNYAIENKYTHAGMPIDISSTKTQDQVSWHCNGKKNFTKQILKQGRLQQGTLTKKVDCSKIIVSEK